MVQHLSFVLTFPVGNIYQGEGTGKCAHCASFQALILILKRLESGSVHLTPHAAAICGLLEQSRAVRPESPLSLGCYWGPSHLSASKGNTEEQHISLPSSHAAAGVSQASSDTQALSPAPCISMGNYAPSGT